MLTPDLIGRSVVTRSTVSIYNILLMGSEAFYLLYLLSRLEVSKELETLVSNTFNLQLRKPGFELSRIFMLIQPQRRM